MATRIYLENGKSWSIACAVDWPGWCRRGKGEQAAIETLLDYAPRYRAVAGKEFATEDVEVIGRLAGSATTDFGAPDARGNWDHERLAGAELQRQVALLQSSWDYFDRVTAGAPEELRKGPRGGGRNRSAIVDHVREAERSYGRKLGPRVPPRTPWPEQRAAYVDALLAGASPDVRWPVRYWLRRTAWHVLDHAWEIEDRSEGSAL